MPHPIEPSTLRILNTKGQTIGTGFLVSKTLAVTCVHVALSASMDGENRIRVQFRDEKRSVFAKVLDEFFDIDRDVAILQVDEVPAGISPLRLGRAGESRLKNDLYTFGYATAAGEQGIGGLGTFIRQDGKFIQFRMHEADHGHSGAPLYDDKRGVVVGMVKKGKDETGRNDETTFAISTETIWQVCPQLKPSTPVLPRRNPIVDGIHLLPYDYAESIQKFWNLYLGDDKNPVPFGGRDDALKMLNDWLNTSTPYLLLAAQAGLGKSALLLRWLNSLSSREDLALVFVPISIRFGTNMQHVFYAALAARLAFLHGDDVPANSETSAAVYRGLVSDYLSKPLANGRTLLIVLDGLDEAADWQAGKDFLPLELPAGVRVAVSARFLAGAVDSKQWLHDLNLERNGLAFAPKLVPLDRVGVADVLQKMGCPLDELSRNVDIVTELYRLSVGDPLLVNLYVGDLWAKSKEVTRLKPEALASIQPGYEGYFDDWWEEQQTFWKNQVTTEGRQKQDEYVSKKIDETQDILNLLSGSLGPLTIDDLLELDQEISSAKLKNTLKHIQRFVIGDGYEQGYTFSHPMLGHFFWERLAIREKRHLEERFVAWGEHTLQEIIDGKRNPKKKDEISIYVVRNYGAHLKRAQKPIEKWLPLIHHQQWAQVWFTVEGAYGGYFQDVQRIWEQCKILDHQSVEQGDKAPYIGQQIRCAFIQSSLHSLAGNIHVDLIPVLANAGYWTWPQTWTFIRQIPEYHQQSSAIIALIPYLTDKQLLNALDTARVILNHGKRAITLGTLAKRLPDVANEALDAAQTVRDKRQRAHALHALALLLPEMAREALDATQIIEAEYERALILRDLVQILPEESLEQVLEAIRALQHESDRVMVLFELTQCVPEEGLWKVLDVTWSLKEDWSRGRVLGGLVKRLPEKFLPQILDSVMTMQEDWPRANVLDELIPRLPDKYLEQAMNAVQAMQEDRPRIYVFAKLAYRILPNGIDKALDTARAVIDEYDRALALGELAQYLPEVAGETLNAIYAIGDDSFSLERLKQLALHLPEQALLQILDGIQILRNEHDRTRILEILARRLPEDGLKQLLCIARAIKDENDRAFVLSVLAQNLPDTVGEALDTIMLVREEEYRNDLLTELIPYLPDSATGQVLELIRKIHNQRFRAALLCILAERLPEIAPEALEAMQAIRDEKDCTVLLGKLSLYLPEAIGMALHNVKTIDYERERVDLLSDFVQYLPAVATAVLDEARKIEYEGSRAIVLSSLALHLPEAASEAIEAVRVIQKEQEYTRVLGELAQRLPEETLPQVLQATLTIQNEHNRANILTKIAQRMPEGALTQVLETTMMVLDEHDRANVLSILAQRLPEDALEQVLAATQGMQRDWSRAIILRNLTQRLSKDNLNQVLNMTQAMLEGWSRSNILGALTQYLPEDSLEQVLDAIRAIEHDGARACALGHFAQRSPTVAEEALKAALAIQIEETRANVLNNLAQNMPENALVQVLNAAQLIQNESDQARILTELAQRIPHSELDQMLNVARTIKDEFDRAYILTKLAQRIPKIAGEALNTTWAMQEGEHGVILEELVQPLMSISSRECYPIMEIALAKLSLQSRASLFSDISLILPVFIYIGSDNIAREIYEAVRDVTTWWP